MDVNGSFQSYYSTCTVWYKRWVVYGTRIKTPWHGKELQIAGKNISAATSVLLCPLQNLVSMHYKICSFVQDLQHGNYVIWKRQQQLDYTTRVQYRISHFFFPFLISTELSSWHSICKHWVSLYALPRMRWSTQQLLIVSFEFVMQVICKQDH